MTKRGDDILGAFEAHDVEGMRAILNAGLDIHAPIKGLSVVNSLLQMYTRSDRLPACLQLLLDAGARADIRLPGLTWGRGFEWETTFFDITPVAYAQLGLMPQVHRNERDIYANVTRLLAAAGRAVPPLPNIPNRYLQPRA